MLSQQIFDLEVLLINYVRSFCYRRYLKDGGRSCFRRRPGYPHPGQVLGEDGGGGGYLGYTLIQVRSQVRMGGGGTPHPDQVPGQDRGRGTLEYTPCPGQDGGKGEYPRVPPV